MSLTTPVLVNLAPAKQDKLAQWLESNASDDLFAVLRTRLVIGAADLGESVIVRGDGSISDSDRQRIPELRDIEACLRVLGQMREQARTTTFQVAQSMTVRER
jgi:hypothetical protein